MYAITQLLRALTLLSQFLTHSCQEIVSTRTTWTYDMNNLGYALQRWISLSNENNLVKYVFFVNDIVSQQNFDIEIGIKYVCLFETPGYRVCEL